MGARPRLDRQGILRVPLTISPTEDQVFSALQAFLASILPAGTETDQTQINRVAEPVDRDYVLMTPGRMIRLGTNTVSPQDVAFTASVSGIVMTVSAMIVGTIVLGATLLGDDLTGAPTIDSQVSGTTGGVGVYHLSSDQGTLTSQTLASGVNLTIQEVEFSIQLDVHGPSSADNSQLISTLLRDTYATEFFFGTAASPLYTEDPRQAPFVNEQNQYENRWVVEVKLQVDQTVGVPQQFADTVAVVLVSVDAPPYPSP